MKTILYRLLQLVTLAVLLTALAWTYYAAEQYFGNAPRFEVRQYSVSGLRRIAETDVLAQTGFSLGTNVFKVDLEGVRQRVERLQWVRHAIVQRVLPDQIMIKVIEREPIGLARIRGENYPFDIDGKILPKTLALSMNAMGAPGRTDFPVLMALRGDDPEGNLKKVETYRDVIAELDQAELSEVHINDAGEVSVVSTSDSLTVSLGTEDFRARWVHYLQLRTEIQEKYPEVVRVDLRFQNQVILRTTNDDDGEKVVCCGAKKIL